MADQERMLWALNLRAVQIYFRLCGRMVVDLGLAGWLLESYTAGWPAGDVVDLIARLERIRAVLDPPPVTPGA